MITDLTTKTLAELTAMTKAELIRTILEGVTDTVLTVSEDGPHGQVRRRSVTRERLTGNVVAVTETRWAYCDSGEVDTITTRHLDANDIEMRREAVKHRRDGRQPERI